MKINTWCMFGGKKPPVNTLLEVLETQTMNKFDAYFADVWDKYGKHGLWITKSGATIRQCESTDCWRVKNANA